MAADLRSLLQEVYDTHGYLTPALVRDVARDPASALHPLVFDKDINEAAEAYYLDRAHQLIRVAKVSFTTASGEPKSLRAFHSTRTEQGYVYHPLDQVTSDPFLAKLVLGDMKREWQQLKARYENFAEFWELVRKDSAA